MTEMDHEEPGLEGSEQPGAEQQEKLQWLAHGDSAFDREDYGRALECYHQASMLDKRDSKVWSNLGLCFSNLGYKREAWRSFKLALQVAEDDHMPLWYAGEFLCEMEDYPLATVLLSRYVQLESDPEYLAEARTLLEEAQGHLGRGDDLEALEDELTAGLSEGGMSISSEEGETPSIQIDTSGRAGKSANSLMSAWRGRGSLAAALAGTDSQRLTGASTVSDSQVHGPEADEETEGSADEAAEDEIIWDDASRSGFVADLGLQLSGFAGRCSFCSTMIPTDAPYCYVCKRPHFYEQE
ncbi:hypothetical protein IT575_06940 [bacterium]|nr:hypothetical protein [bacterium]